MHVLYRKIVPALLAATLSLGILSSGDTAHAAAATAAAPSAPSRETEVLVTGDARAVATGRAVVSNHLDLPVVGGFAAVVTDEERSALVALGLRVTDNAPVHVTDADWGAGSHDASAVYPQVDGATSAWAGGLDGSGVTVAVVDTGISSTDDLAGKVIDGYDFSGEGDYKADSFGHGTFVAGLIAGSGAASGGAVKGIAPGVSLVSLKVAGADGSSDVIRVIAAIQWAVNHAVTDRIRVLNLSLGTDSTQSWRIDPLDAAVEGAWREGLVVTAAAGNQGSAGITKPGDDPYVITVGSTDDATTPRKDDDLLAPFSSTGPTADGVAKPDLVAPGAHVVSTRSLGSTVDQAFPAARIDPVYLRGSGTSFSAPQVAGAAALLLQQRPKLTNNQVKGQLTATAWALPDVARTAQGAGALDIAAALAAPTASASNSGLARSDGSGSPADSQGSLRYAARPSGSDKSVWNVAPWNSTGWTSTGWTNAAWNSTGWTSTGWTSTGWTSTGWTYDAWASTGWTSTGWTSTGWTSTGWTGAGWAAASFWSAAWD